MWFPLSGIDGSGPLIDTGRFCYQIIQEDIESLNERAESVGDLDITAASLAHYPFLADRYAITSCGASMGDSCGPKVVALASRLPEPALPDHPANLTWLAERARMAIPGTRTSAYLTASILLGRRPAKVRAIDFKSIVDAVAAGELFDAGIVIHEGQLTFQDSGLCLIVDLGQWWTSTRHVPMPLGGNLIKRDLENRFGPGTLREVTATLVRSIQWALNHRNTSVEYAMRFARDITAAQADEFIRMYVNPYTLNLGSHGRLALARLFAEAQALRFIPSGVPIDIVEPAVGPPEFGRDPQKRV